ncbi:unnamed protein product [Arabis nemorensis]|uniref:SURP motif domain-containing protein n=1 Tax=Arabis nemorensis TaxID=586526 RepID=A0A565BGF4_9BRAS|nr:unnamed protein product [Arabis nemorensis]
MRSMLNHTASFIAEKRSEFEKKIMSVNVNDAIFNFLRSSDPHHAFYQQKITEYRARIQAQFRVPPKVTVTLAPVPQPPREELGIIKLTAQFVARYGRFVMFDLMKMKDRQFDFLNPKDYRFNFFTKVVESYAKVMKTPQDFKKTLGENVNATTTILEGFFRLSSTVGRREENEILEMTESEWARIESEFFC